MKSSSLLAFLIGFASLSLQFVYNRIIFFYVVNTDYATATVISLHLVGFLAGAVLARAWQGLCLNTVVLALPVTVCVAYLITWHYGLDIIAIGPLLICVAVFAFLTAFISGIIIAKILMLDSPTRHYAPVIVAADTFGSALGAIFTGFFALPIMGIEASYICLGIAALLPVFLMGRRMAVQGAALALIACLAASINFTTADSLFRVKGFPLVGRTAENTVLVDSVQTPHGVLSVLDYGPGLRRLMIDNMILCALAKDGTDLRVVSEWEIGNWPATLMSGRDNPRIAIVGLGCGITLSGALDALGDKPAVIDMIDINDAMPRMTKHFTQVTGPTVDDKRVTLKIHDGFSYFVARDHKAPKYDTIIIDITWMRDGSLTQMFSRELFDAARLALKPDGVFALWNEESSGDSPITRTTYATIQSVFPYVVARNFGNTINFYASQQPEILASLPAEDQALTTEVRMKSAGAPLNTLDQLVLGPMIFANRASYYSYKTYLKGAPAQ